MSYPVCPACGGNDHMSIESVNGYSILSCRSCRLSFSDPMRAGDVGYYKAHLVYKDTDAVTIAQHCRSVDNASNRRLLAMLPKGARILDLGCGYGAFVHLALRNGYDAFGLDFNEQHIRAGREALSLEDRLIVDDIKEYSKKNGRDDGFDLVTLFEVIEHVESPGELLDVIRSLLREDGLLAISCPNEGRWQPTGRVFVDYPPHHLTRWSPATLKLFLERRGFEHVETELESSFWDPLWVAYVNRSARRKEAIARSPSDVPNGRSTLLRAAKMSLLRSVKVICAPFDLVLKTARVGTMGMRVVARKREE